jgi:hypothetical protein
VEPPHTYLQDTASLVVHHEDYLNDRRDHALCGVAFVNPAPLDAPIRPAAVCPDCEAKLVEYHLAWWRERAEAATAALDELRIKYRELAERVDSRRDQIAGSPQPAQASDHANGEELEGHREDDDEAPLAGATADQGETTPTSLLDQARTELMELCRRFEGTIPYWRLKNSMDAFNDKLTSDERVLLAQEIGADGSLIRWCTRVIEELGWQVTNNPVHGDADDMMDAWTEDFYQARKKTKWRLGRSRSQDGS